MSGSEQPIDVRGEAGMTGLWPEENRGTCPRCGSGDVIHVVHGMPAPFELEWAPQWVEFAGCVVDGELTTRRCDHCGARWNPSGGAGAGELTVHNVEELLTATETTSLEELAEVSSEDYELDVDLVPSAAELEIRGRRVGITLPFPFDLEDFWEAIDDANEEAEHIEG
jgi:rRNA maturation protein Nop10